MPLVNLRTVLDHAASHGYGVPAFNVNNLEQIQAIMEAAQAIDRIAAIHAQIPDTHLVMHGSSSVPQEWLAIIRQYGGDIRETYGVPVEEIVRGIRHGVRKVNIDTDIRLAMTGAMREAFARQPAEFDPRKALEAARKAARGICQARFEAFGCAGHGGAILRATGL